MMLFELMNGALARMIADRLTPAGLNLVGAAAIADYDAAVRADLRILPRFSWARSALVIGNGGGEFWQSFEKHCAEYPATLASADQLDAYTRTIIEPAAAAVSAAAGFRTELLFPFDYPAVPVSFMDLAVAAGLGAPSLLGVLVHPRFGPWMALRGALLVEAELEAERPAEGFDPCPTCVEKPCIAACPAGAVRPAASWDFVRCIEHRLESRDCVERCHARVACVYGPSERYPDRALEYHQRCAWNAMRHGPPRK